MNNEIENTEFKQKVGYGPRRATGTIEQRLAKLEEVLMDQLQYHQAMDDLYELKHEKEILDRDLGINSRSITYNDELINRYESKQDVPKV